MELRGIAGARLVDIGVVALDEDQAYRGAAARAVARVSPIDRCGTVGDSLRCELPGRYPVP